MEDFRLQITPYLFLSYECMTFHKCSKLFIKIETHTEVLEMLFHTMYEPAMLDAKLKTRFSNSVF